MFSYCKFLFFRIASFYFFVLKDLCFRIASLYFFVLQWPTMWGIIEGHVADVVNALCNEDDKFERCCNTSASKQRYIDPERENERDIEREKTREIEREREREKGREEERALGSNRDI